MIQEAIANLVQGRDLSRADSVAVMNEIADGGATPAQVGAFLAALRLKGETVDEIAGAAEVMRSRAEKSTSARTSSSTPAAPAATARTPSTSPPPPPSWWRERA